MLRAEADVGVGGEVEDEIAPGHRGGQAVEVEDVALHERELRRLTGRIEELREPGRQVVVADNRMPRCEQAIDEVTADETGGAGDKYTLHTDSSGP